MKIEIIFCFLSSFVFSQKLSINETLDYIESIENIYTNRVGYVSGNEGITVRNDFSFNEKDGVLTKTEYWVNKGETINQIEKVHINDLSNEVKYLDKFLRLKCINDNCVEVFRFKYDNSTSRYTKDYYIDNSNYLNIYIVQEYNAKKVLNAINYLFSLFNELKLERDSNDPFAQSKYENVTLENLNSSSIQLKDVNGTFYIPVNIGGKTENFILDSGASDTTISSVIESFLIKNGIITKQDYLSDALYKIADGSVVSQRRFILKKLKVGNFKVKNLIISVGDENSPLLLGKNFLDKFETWTIDNSKKTIKLKTK